MGKHLLAVNLRLWWRTKSSKSREMAKSWNLFVGVSLSKGNFSLGKISSSEEMTDSEPGRGKAEPAVKNPPGFRKSCPVPGEGVGSSPAAAGGQSRLLCDTHCSAGPRREDQSPNPNLLLKKKQFILIIPLHQSH